jgi:hypothetical protein
LPAYGGNQHAVFPIIVRNSKKRVEYDLCTTIVRQTVQQGGVQRSIPGPSPLLLESIVRLIVHENEHDLVGWRARAKSEEIIVTGIHPEVPK